MNKKDEEQFSDILHEVADFNAIYETLQEKLRAREFALEQKLTGASQQLMNQLTEIQRSLEVFANFMTAEGAARGRMAIKQAKEEAQNSLAALKNIGDDIKLSITETGARLDILATQALTRVDSIAHSFPATEFKQVTQQSCHEIKNTSTNALQQLGGYIKTFHRKNLIMAFMLTLFMAFILGLYLNGEWPWEIHQKVMKERNAGRTLLRAWPKLTPAQQQDIMAAARRNTGV